MDYSKGTAAEMLRAGKGTRRNGRIRSGAEVPQMRRVSPASSSVTCSTSTAAATRRAGNRQEASEDSTAAQQHEAGLSHIS